MNDIKGEIKKNEALQGNQGTVEQVTSFLIRATILALFLLLIAGSWYLASKNSLKRINDNIIDVDSQLVAYQDLDKELVDFQGAIANIDSAMKQKKNYSGIFKEIANVIPKEAYLSGISIDTGGKVKIDGTASGLSSMARVLVAFNQDKDDPTKPNKILKSVLLSNFALSGGKVTFSLSASAAPEEVK